MNRFVALTLLIVVPVTGVVLAWRPPQGGDELESPVQSMSLLDAAATLHQEAEKRIELDGEFLRVEASIARKREIARRVIDNTLTLSEAAALFRGLIEECRYANLVHRANEGASEDERIYRDVIGWVEGELGHDPMRMTEIVSRLKSEVESQFR